MLIGFAPFIIGLAALTISFAVYAQLSGIDRVDLQRRDLGIQGKEIVQSRFEIYPDVVAPKHSHPGEEVVYILEGELEYQLEGRAPVTVKAGEVLFIPAGVIHSAKNTGKKKCIELATYIVEKDKPLSVFIK